MIKFDFIIEDNPWKVTLLSEEEYNTGVDSTSEAEVDLNQRQIVFNYNRLTIPTIEHEITHIYIDHCCLRSVDNFETRQMEEIIAEFVPKHARKIIKVSRELKKIIDKKILDS